jgi:hypothetical protein
MSHKGLVLVRNFLQSGKYLPKHAIQVTGVTGFIAGHVADQFLNAGYQVRG